jgi:hypothetical protein
MANPTTNYGFVLPTSADLVTDLPADFDVALQGVDTRLKALQPGTTLGDIDYSSATANTNTRLGIGSTGQVLTVASGVPAWAAAGGMTLISTTNLTGSSVSLTSIAQTYKHLQVIVLNAFASANDNILLRCNTDTAANYSRRVTKVSGTSNSASTSTITGFAICQVPSTSSSEQNGLGVADLFNYTATSGGQLVRINGRGYDGTSLFGNFDTGVYYKTAAITSVQLTMASGTFSGGTVQLYGVN